MEWWPQRNRPEFERNSLPGFGRYRQTALVAQSESHFPGGEDGRGNLGKTDLAADNSSVNIGTRIRRRSPESPSLGHEQYLTFGDV
jgi:hypothetical protein